MFVKCACNVIITSCGSQKRIIKFNDAILNRVVKPWLGVDDALH